MAAGAEAAVSYSYDLVGRITRAVYDNATCISYGYDANGNRSSQANTSGGAPVSPVWGSGTWGCFFWTP
jgi:YD repeat-containing protein